MIVESAAAGGYAYGGGDGGYRNDAPSVERRRPRRRCARDTHRRTVGTGAGGGWSVARSWPDGHSRRGDCGGAPLDGTAQRCRRHDGLGHHGDRDAHGHAHENADADEYRHAHRDAADGDQTVTRTTTRPPTTVTETVTEYPDGEEGQSGEGTLTQRIPVKRGEARQIASCSIRLARHLR